MSVLKTIKDRVTYLFTGKQNQKVTRSKQTEQSTQISLQMGSYGGLMPVYSPGEDFESNEAHVTCIQTNATYCSKAEFSSVRITDDGEQIHDYKHLDYLLQFSPNPFMTASVFWERVRSFYDMYNNAFIYVEKSPLGEIIAFWSIDPSLVQFAKTQSGEILFRFDLNGKTLIIPYSLIIHIQRHVVKNAIFGDKCKVLKRVIDLINLNTKGLENAILTSTLIRYLGKVNTKLSDKELKKKAKKFTENYLKIKPNDPVAIAFTDSTVDVEKMESGEQKTASYAETNQWNKSIYKFYGCPEKVIAGEANEDEMTAYYERAIDSFFDRTAQELTRKIFTDREFEVGNRIVFKSSKLLYMSTKTRLEVFRAAREIGAFTLGTLGDLLGLPVPKGKRNVVVTSQNYNDSLKDQTPADGGNGNKEDGANASNK